MLKPDGGRPLPGVGFVGMLVDAFVVGLLELTGFLTGLLLLKLPPRFCAREADKEARPGVPVEGAAVRSGGTGCCGCAAGVATVALTTGACPLALKGTVCGGCCCCGVVGGLTLPGGLLPKATLFCPAKVLLLVPVPVLPVIVLVILLLVLVLLLMVFTVLLNGTAPL